MAKSINALGSIENVKKQIEKKNKALKENQVYEELISSQENLNAPIIEPMQQNVQPISQPVIVQQTPAKNTKNAKAPISELFEKHVGNLAAVSIKMDKAMLKEVDKICKQNNISRTAFISKAVEVLLNTYDY